MKRIYAIGLSVVFIVIALSSCKSTVTELQYDNPDMKIIFLHHSTGQNIWFGDVKQGKRLNFSESMCMVPRLVKEYNDLKGKKISISERKFPSGDPYPWENYPYDYYNIWVKNAGPEPYMEEPTLEMLTKDYDIIIFKHCFPVSKVLEDDGNPDIDSKKKTFANYKLQYDTLRAKLHEFPETEFIVWTGAALVEAKTTEQEAGRAMEFTNWVINEWDVPGDNIELFDFRSLETMGGLFLDPGFVYTPEDSHPNMELSVLAAKSFVEKIISVVEK